MSTHLLPRDDKLHSIRTAGGVSLLSSMLNTMNQLRKRGELCDFLIQVEGGKIPVHRIVLNAVSPFFRTIFANEKLEAKRKQCYLSVAFHAVETCVESLYSGQLNLDKDNVSDVLKVSYLWELEQAVEKCKRFLRENLDCSSCILVTKLATLYKFGDLSECCRDFALENIVELTTREDIRRLDVTEIEEMVKADRHVSVRCLWGFCVAWYTRKSHENGNEKLACRINSIFPFEKFGLATFKARVWESIHVKSCETCQRFAATKLLDDIDSCYDVDLGDGRCLFLKQLSKTYCYRRLEKMADDYVIENHRKVFECAKFLDLGKEDLLAYVGHIEDSISTEEFSALIRWLKYHSNRHNAFCEIFRYAEYPCIKSHSSKFLSSIEDISSLCGSDEDCFITYSTSNISDNTRDIQWWPKDCFFLKLLAQKYGYKNTETEIDRCIVRDFRRTSKTDDFLDLPVEEVAKYLSDSMLYDAYDTELIWDSVVRWARHDIEGRRRDFPKIFEAMLIDKFSTRFLRETVMVSTLVTNSLPCMSRIIRIILLRVEENEKKIERLERRSRKREHSQ